MKDLSPWGPRHVTEPTHDKTFDVAFELGIHPMQAYGHISAFRARILAEAPSGRLRGGVAQVERLAVWDGKPGLLAAAFVKASVIDDINGELVAHEHDLYGGASLQARNRAADRTKRWRENRERVSVNVTRDVTVDVTEPSPHLTSSDPDLSSGGGPGEVPAHTPTHALPASPESSEPVSPSGVESAIEAIERRSRAVDPAKVGAVLKAVTQATRSKRSQTIVGLAEAESRPKTAESFCALPFVRSQIPRYPALDGNNGRPTFVEAVTAKWPSFERKADNDGTEAAARAMLLWIAQDYPRFKASYERDVEKGAPSVVTRSEKAKQKDRELQRSYEAVKRDVEAQGPVDVSKLVAEAKTKITKESKP